MRIKTICEEKVLPYLYTGTMFFSATASAGSTFVAALYSKLPSGRFTTPSAYALGMIVGVIEMINTHFFEVPVIRRYLSKYKLLEQDDETTLFNRQVSLTWKKKSTYLAIKYFYIPSAIMIDFFNLCLLVSAAKALAEDLGDGENVPLSNLTPPELAFITLYFASFDLPFVLTNKITQACREIRRQMNIPSERAPDAAFVDLFEKVIRPFAKLTLIRKSVSILGSISDTGQHLAPLPLLIPASWLLTIANQPPLIAWSAGVGGACILLVIGGIVLAQTILFEGKFSETNLKKIAWPNKRIEPAQRWVPKTIAKGFGYSMNVGGPLQGFGEAFAIVAALRELSLHPAVIASGGIVTFLIVTWAKHNSEVASSKDALLKITRHSENSLSQRISGTGKSFFFRMKHPDYGTNSAQIVQESLLNPPSSRPSGLGIQ